jgi:hypothetical protein
MMPFTQVSSYQKGVQPPELVPYLDKTVRQVWVTRTIFVVIFDDGSMLAFRAQANDTGQFMFQCMRGSCANLTDGELEELGMDSGFTARIQGRKFTGLDENIVTFDGIYGARLHTTSIEWVVQRPAAKQD